MVAWDHSPQDKKRPHSTGLYCAPHYHRVLSCFTVRTRQFTLNASAGVRLTNAHPAMWNNVNKNSSDQMTCFHCSCVQFRCLAFSGDYPLQHLSIGVLRLSPTGELRRRHISQVVVKFGFSCTTISQVYREYQESSKATNLRHRCCQKNITEERVQRRLTRTIKWDRRATLPQIAADLNDGPSTSITARQHRHWTVDDWKHNVCSDESRFHLNRADGRVWVWKQPYESMNPTCQQGTVQACGGSVIVWGVCNWRDM
ncbi:HTH_Tnp_Tc3_2 domain-containing protein [Trichonephila clavipes]|nr:HTH_Tnp_Tc3_2 domain-containing protein [Trichonephila clavipes]